MFQRELSTFTSIDLTVIIRDKVGQNRSIDLQSCSNAVQISREKNKHTYILHRWIYNVMP